MESKKFVAYAKKNSILIKMMKGHVQKYGGTFAKGIQIYSDC